MKFIYKSMVVMLAFVVTSCEMFDLEKQDSPNAVTPNNAGVDFLYNNIQLSFNSFYRASQGSGAALARQRVFSSPLYQTGYSATAFDGRWTTAYAGLLPDMSAMEALAEAQGLQNYIACSKIMRSYVLTTLVDMFGDVPLDEANQGTDFISPNSVAGDQVYAAAETLLDEALTILGTPESPDAAFPQLDLYFDGDHGDWVALANTFKLRIALNTRLVDAGAGAKIAALASQPLVGSGGSDFEFQYGTQRTNPGNRHPDYNNMYEVNDGAYMNNWYMYMLMKESKEDVNWNGNAVVLSNGDVSRTDDDPRLRWYFYRKDPNLSNQTVNEWSCFITDLPDDASPQQLAHLIVNDPNMPYCYARIDGYYGRSHGNNEGIPPDGPIRSAYGMYPAGGRFDENSFEDTQNSGTDGALGEGITPIMIGAFVDFMRAEAALMAGSGEDDRALLESGMRASFAKVYSFVGNIDLGQVVGSDVNGNDITLEDAFLADWDNDVDDYVDDVLAVYDAATADGKLEIIMEEYMISLWGNGVEAYNALRRTSKPTRIAPNLQVGTDDFTWSYLYPSVHVDRNQNVTQKLHTDKVFWDNTAIDAVK